MADDRPIDKKRNSAGAFSIGSLDEGATTSMTEIDGSLYIFKKKAIYAMQMADQIDPDRTNPDLSNVVHRKVLSEGSDSEIVGRTLLTAITLIGTGKFLPKSFAHKEALKLSLNALIEMISMRSTASEFDVVQQQAFAKVQESKRDSNSMQLPFIGDVSTRCKTFAQRADHAAGTLFKIVQLFYTDIGTRGWIALHERVIELYGEDDPFAQFLNAAVPFLLLVRNTRNCMDHNRPDAIVRDFTLLPNGEIVAPSIEMKYRESLQPLAPISEFMSDITDSMPIAFEAMLACLCSKHAVPPDPNFPLVVGTLEDGQRREKHVQYYFGTYMGDQFVPIG